MIQRFKMVLSLVYPVVPISSGLYPWKRYKAVTSIFVRRSAGKTVSLMLPESIPDCSNRSNCALNSSSNFDLRYAFKFCELK